MKLFDLSLPIDPDSGDPAKPKIDYQDHDAGVAVLARMFGLAAEDIPDGKGSAAEVVHARTHSGTHLDAPYHYFPTSEGRPAKTIDQIPLEWCYGPGVVLDLSHLPAGAEIGVGDLAAATQAIDYAIRPRDIVFIRTDAYKHYHSPEYPSAHPGMSAEATLWLIEKGVKVMGIDAWAWDCPFKVQGARYLQGGKRDKSVLWAAHRVGKEHEFLHLEQLANLDRLPRPRDFIASVLPIKVSRASAGWVRAAAIFPDLE